MFNGHRYLLIDSATPLIQVAVIEDGNITAAKSSLGNAIDLVPAFVQVLQSGTGLIFDNFDGMIYCSGPGSALGLRIALVSIKTWRIFSEQSFELMEYNSLDMSLCLNPEIKSICTHGVGDDLIVKTRGNSDIKVLVEGEVDFGNDVLFLDTRRVRSDKYKNFGAANYTIGDIDGGILSICKISDGELKNYGDSSTYKKWKENLY
jgi:hypothetical protein